MEVWVNNPAAGGFDITPDVDGWIKVPPMYPVAPMVSGTGWRFVPGADLINLVTTGSRRPCSRWTRPAWPPASPANAPDTDVHYGIRM